MSEVLPSSVDQDPIHGSAGPAQANVPDSPNDVAGVELSPEHMALLAPPSEHLLKAAKPFDAMVKQSFDADPGAMLRLAMKGNPAPMEVRDMKFTSMPTEHTMMQRLMDHAQRVAMRGLDGQTCEFVNITEAMSYYDPLLEPRLALYNSLACMKTTLWVLMVLILVRPEAEQAGSPYTGRWSKRMDPNLPFDAKLYGGLGIHIEYLIIRIWEHPALELAKSGSGLAIFSCLGKMDDPGKELPKVVAATLETFEADRLAGKITVNQMESDVAVMAAVISRTYAKEIAMGVFETVPADMKNDPGFRYFVNLFGKEARIEGEAKGKAEGKAEGLTEGVLDLGNDCLGEAPSWVHARLAAASVAELRAWLKRVPKSKSWRELLGDA